MKIPLKKPQKELFFTVATNVRNAISLKWIRSQVFSKDFANL